MKNISIIGSGSFGCALSYILSKNKENNIKIWSYKKEEADLINNEHKCMYLADLILDKNIKCYINYEEALINSDYIFLVTPSKVIRQTCKDIKKYINNQKIIIASKGLENNTNKLLSEVVKEELPDNEISVISGPSHAEQIIKDIPTIISFSSNNINFYNEIKNIIETDKFKIKYTNDLIGVQLGGALKNIIALLSGIIEGLNYESNTISYIITEGLREIKEIGVKLGAKEETFYDLSGLGDLLTTCISEDSRNKRAGILLANGKTIEEIQKEIGMVIEGLDALKVGYELSRKYNLNLNLINNLYKFIYETKNIEEFMKSII